MNIKEIILAKIRGSINLNKLKKEGLKVGKNFHAMEGVIIDPGHCWLITIGDNVTLAPRVHILAHDASTKKFIGYTRIAKVNIGDNVFLGANTVVLPGVNIGNNCIVGAGSVVTKNLDDNSIYAGNPAKKINGLEKWIENRKEELLKLPLFDDRYKIKNINKEMKLEMIKELEGNSGYII
ncbi:acyltransferase [Clostridium perfringens]|uniref:acyltransferase n=1 Tax=Clostridium perfringens TaxID=1502 RepID=UPI0039EC8D73